MQDQCENITLDDILLTCDGYFHIIMEGERSLHLKDNDGSAITTIRKTSGYYAENGRGGWNFSMWWKSLKPLPIKEAPSRTSEAAVKKVEMGF
ncbi:hypothetical protein ACFOLK_16085 [Marinococcus halophilus]|uniref:hypothetical protein n=1 Tax=Marinococcus halophilus TaxID=1371 RepID=UPI00361A7DA7